MNIVILAAGMGKRMHSRLPKVLQPIAGRPMLDHVLETTRGFSEAPSVVVVGHCADEVKSRYDERDDLVFALQEPQLGTGHALMTAVPHLCAGDPHTLVCLGDVPLLSKKTIAAMREECGMNDLVLLTVKLDNPKGYGRIVRDEFGRVTSIVEEKDATAEEKLIREVNTGIMVLPTAKLEAWLSALTNTNAQGEYYLTDVIGLAAGEGSRIATVHPENVYEVEGVNSKRQLAQLEPFVYAVAVWYARGELFERGLNLAAAAFARVVFPPQADRAAARKLAQKALQHAWAVGRHGAPCGKICVAHALLGVRAVGEDVICHCVAVMAVFGVSFGYGRFVTRPI